MASPIDPAGTSGATKPHPLLYVLLALVLANLVITVRLYQGSSTSPQPHAVPTALPPYLSRDALSELAGQVKEDFNSRNWASFYDQFDPVAQVQFNQDELASQFERLGPLIGKIERAEYSHHKFIGRQDAGDAFELHYVLEVSGGTFGSGVMTVTFIDRGDHPGIFSVFLNGKG